MKTKWIAVVAFVSVVMALTGVSVAQAQSGEDPAQVAAGEEIFNSNCAGCHGADGTGTSSGRPLTGIAGQEPDRTVHIASVTDGKGGMPAFGAGLSADEIDAAVAYARDTFVADSDELPRTGLESNLILIAGLGLLGAGVVTMGSTRRRLEVEA